MKIITVYFSKSDYEFFSIGIKYATCTNNIITWSKNFKKNPDTYWVNFILDTRFNRLLCFLKIKYIQFISKLKYITK